MRITTICSLLLLLLLVLVSGCGGGGGESSTLGSVFPSTSTPTGLTATAGGSTMNLSWNPVERATSYNLYWGTSTGVSKTSRKIADIGGTTFQHTNLTIGRTYYYIVTANFSYGEGPASTEVAGVNTNYSRESEPNDAVDTATPVVVGGDADAVRGQLASDTDVDFYTFGLSADGNVVFAIKADDAVVEEGLIKATILASDGTTVIASLDQISGYIYHDTATDTTQTYTLNATLLTGKYYLKFENSPAGAGFRKDYIVSLR